jgi:hypothetical protein
MNQDFELSTFLSSSLSFYREKMTEQKESKIYYKFKKSYKRNLMEMTP